MVAWEKAMNKYPNVNVLTDMSAFKTFQKFSPFFLNFNNPRLHKPYTIFKLFPLSTRND